MRPASATPILFSLPHQAGTPPRRPGGRRPSGVRGSPSLLSKGVRDAGSLSMPRSSRLLDLRPRSTIKRGQLGDGWGRRPAHRWRERALGYQDRAPRVVASRPRKEEAPTSSGELFAWRSVARGEIPRLAATNLTARLKSMDEALKQTKPRYRGRPKGGGIEVRYSRVPRLASRGSASKTKARSRRPRLPGRPRKRA